MLGKIGKSMVVVPFSSVEWGDDGIDESWIPKHHMYYGDRVMDIDDDLPKYDQSFQQGQREQREQVSAPAPKQEQKKDAAGAAASAGVL